MFQGQEHFLGQGMLSLSLGQHAVACNAESAGGGSGPALPLCMCDTSCAAEKGAGLNAGAKVTSSSGLWSSRTTEIEVTTKRSHTCIHTLFEEHIHFYIFTILFT